MFLAVILLGIVVRMVTLNRKQMEKPAASFRIQQEVLALQEFLRRDLKETHLSTVRIYPNSDYPNEPPGISMVSNRTLLQDEAMTTSAGHPYWQKTVYYTLEDDPDREGTGRLVRMEGVTSGLPSTSPKADSKPPSQATIDPRRKKVLSRFIVMPNEKLPGLNKTTTDQGGFEASFIDEEGDSSRTDFLQHPIVNVNLIFMEKSASTGKPTIMNYEIRMYPEN